MSACFTCTICSNGGCCISLKDHIESKEFQDLKLKNIESKIGTSGVDVCKFKFLMLCFHLPPNRYKEVFLRTYSGCPREEVEEE